MNQDMIEDALQTYPLAEMPAGLSQTIMGKIRATNRARIAAPRIPFRLTWVDYALAFFFALLPLVGFVIWATLPRLAVLRLSFQWQLIQANGFLPLIIGSLAVAGAFVLLAILISVSIFFPNEPMRKA